MKLCKQGISVLGATVLLSALVSSASARNLSVSSQTIKASFSRVSFSGGFGITECIVSLEGSLHTRTTAKVEGSLIGFINRASLGACSRGTATILQASLPWHVKYVGFAGTLPNITQLYTEVTGSAFQIREPVFQITCLASGGIPEIVYNVINRELVSAEIFGTSPTSCGSEGELTSSLGVVTAGNNRTRIRITLI